MDSQMFRAMLDEFRRNPRLQFGGVVIALLVVGWLFLVLGDVRKQQFDALMETRQELDQVRELARQRDWSERAESATRVADSLASELTPAVSAGLAQADFQGWLRELVDSQNANLRLEVQAPTPVDEPTGVVRVSATISGGLPPARVLQLISRIEGRVPLSTIPVATIRSDGLNQTFSLTVHGFYQLAQAGPTP